MSVQRRALSFHNFDDLTADLQRLRGGCRTVGKWSLAQMCEHLQTFMDGSLSGFGFKMPWYFRLGSPLILRYTLKKRWMPAGVKGPAAAMPKLAGVTDAAAVDSLLAAIERYRRDNGPVAPSPMFGAISRQTWDELHLIHAAHHLSFAIPTVEVAAS